MEIKKLTRKVTCDERNEPHNTMTTQQARDEFVGLRYDDENFAKQYSADDFQSWLDDNMIGLDD